MLFDINTAIGHWPFRQLSCNTVPELRRRLEVKGIRGAAVANTHGIFYKNCHDANHELFSNISKHIDFFTGVATLNPLYPVWQRDLEQCVNEFGFRALRMLPLYHNYKLSGNEAGEMADAAGNLGIPVILPSKIVDFRQMHWMDVPRPLGFEEIKDFCERHKATNFIITESIFSIEQLEQTDCANIYLEMSRYRSAYGHVLRKIIDLIGTDHVLFGSGAPFKEITPALLKLKNADLTSREEKATGSGNAKRLLGLK